MSVTLDDFEIRYKNIREQNPDIESCGVKGCNNPVDITMMGKDTSCSYHRMLFDAWHYHIIPDKIMYYMDNQKARRTAFTKWRNKIGKEACDKIVLEMAQEPINWEC